MPLLLENCAEIILIVSKSIKIELNMTEPFISLAAEVDTVKVLFLKFNCFVGVA